MEEAFLSLQCSHSDANNVRSYVRENVYAHLLRQNARLSSAINLSFQARR